MSDLNTVFNTIRNYNKIDLTNPYQKRLNLVKSLNIFEKIALNRPKNGKDFKYHFLYKKAISEYSTRSRYLKMILGFCAKNKDWLLYKPGMMSLLRRELRINSEEIRINFITSKELSRLKRN